MATENNNKTLNVPNLRFPEFSGEWEQYRLGNLVEIRSGVSPTGVIDGEGVFPFYKVEQLNNCYIYLGTTPYMTNQSVIPANSIVFPKRGAAIMTNKIRISSKPCQIDTNLMALSIISSKEFDYKFIYYFIDLYNLSKIADTSTIPQINNIHINPLKIKIPSICEQKKISDFLSLLDDRIATQIKIIEKLESLIRGISNNLLYSESGTPVRLGDILSERSERTKVNNQHEVLSSTVKGIFSQREYFSKDIASENNVGYKVIRLYDVVLSPQNLWMGNINYNDKFDIGIVSPSYKIFSIADGYDKRFVAAMLKTHRALYNYMLVSEQGASVVRRNLNMEAFEQLVFKMPPIDKQREIGNAISALQSRLELAVRVKTGYEKQKQWLLTEMFI